jgi:hypothetical protein
MENLKESSSEYLELARESAKYDYAILKLERNVKRDSYPILFPDFGGFGKRVIVSGYSNERDKKEIEKDDYKQSFHGNLLEQPPYKIGGMYDIDTKPGQSGSPVYFIDEEDETCCVVGIHKAYDPKIKKNVCTLITKEVLENLQKWMGEMSLLLRVKGEQPVAPVVPVLPKEPEGEDKPAPIVPVPPIAPIKKEYTKITESELISLAK